MADEFEVIGDPVEENYYQASNNRPNRRASKREEADYDDQGFDEDAKSARRGRHKISTSEARNLAMLCHILVYIGGIMAPLIIWSMKKEEHPFLDDQGKESLNFQISLIIYSFITIVLCFLIVGFLLLPILAIYSMVMPLIAGLAASKGEHYRYPFILRIIK
jgi:uncharacterized protein